MATMTSIPDTETPRQAAACSALTSMTYEELLSVLRAARKRRTRDWCMLVVAYCHGLRTTEVCALKRSDLRDGMLCVQRRKGSRATVQRLRSYSHEPLLDEVKALRAWLKVRPRDRSDVLFTSQKGGPLHRSQFFRIFQSAARAAGLPESKAHPRVLKYSLAAHLLAGNAGVGAVSEILGHRSLYSTLRYLRAGRSRSANQPSRRATESLWRPFGVAAAYGPESSSNPAGSPASS